MTEQLISFKTAKLAKEKGFGPEFNINHWYNQDGKPDCHYQLETFPRTTLSLLQKWLREEDNTYVYCIPFDNTFEAWLPCLNGKVLNIGAEEYSYEQALELGLQEALK